MIDRHLLGRSERSALAAAIQDMRIMLERLAQARRNLPGEFDRGDFQERLGAIMNRFDDSNN